MKVRLSFSLMVDCSIAELVHWCSFNMCGVRYVRCLGE